MKLILNLVAALACLASAEGHADPVQPRAEDIIVFRHSSIVCLTMDALHRALISSANGETTKVSAMMMDSSNPDAPCWMIDPTRRVKVLSATYRPEAFAGLLEIVGEHTKSAHGAWVLSPIHPS